MPRSCASAACTASTSGAYGSAGESLAVAGSRISSSLGDQVGDDLGVGRRLAIRSRRSASRCFERAEVLDHAVVDERDDRVAADVRMGVRVGRRAVRRPARVAEADRAAERATSCSLAARSSIRPAVLVIVEPSPSASSSSIVTTPELS